MKWLSKILGFTQRLKRQFLHKKITQVLVLVFYFYLSKGNTNEGSKHHDKCYTTHNKTLSNIQKLHNLTG